MSRRYNLMVPFALSALALTAGSMSVYAQTAEGSLYGKAKPGSQVVITNPDTGVTRNLVADTSGNYSASRLSPGKYTVSVDGAKIEAFVTIGASTLVEKSEALQTVEVGSRRAGAIDFTSAGASYTFSQDDVQALPVALSATSVALLAPTVVRGDSYLSTPSFGGASQLENAYYINGFDVTNIHNFSSYADLPYEAVAAQQVKSGGYGAEYGRSLGGVISLATKRGTNEWKGGITAEITPDSFRTKGHDVLDKQPERAGLYYIFNKDSVVNNKNYVAYLGGPVIKDRFFFFALMEKPDYSMESFGQTQALVTSTNTPKGFLKLDLNLWEGHTLEATGIYNKSRNVLVDYVNSKPYSKTLDGLGAESHYTTGGSVAILKYTGAITDNFTVSALGGRVGDLSGNPIIGARNIGAECPRILAVDLSPRGCAPYPNPGAPVYPQGPEEDIRTAYRVDLEYKLGGHALRGGVDHQKFVSYSGGGSYFTGGVYYRYYTVPSSGVINGVGGNTSFVAAGGKASSQCTDGTAAQPLLPQGCYVREWVYTTDAGAYSVENSAWYVEDSWSVNDRLTVYAGLRGESFDNRDAVNQTFVKADNLTAPRLGFSLDASSDRSTKIFGTAGRYYIPVASNTNIRASRGETYVQRYYKYTGVDSKYLPTGLTKVGVDTDQSTAPPTPGTVSDTKLSPMNQDEFVLGIERRLESQWKIGAKLIYRKINAGMDDWCDLGTVQNFMFSKGYKNFDWHSLASCMLVNPGRDVNLLVDANNDGKLVGITIPANYVGLPTYQRTYQAVELTFQKPFNGKWSLQGSYVYSKSRGTSEGYAQSTLKQEDAGITQDYDYASMMQGAYGALPNDRTHVLKLFGNYQVASHLRAGFNMTAATGRPVSCIGFVPPTVKDYYKPDGTLGSGNTAYSAGSYYCSNDQGKTVLGNRGDAGRTPFTVQVDGQLAYVRDDLRAGKMTIQADVFNLFNNRKPITVNEVRDYSRQTTDGLNNELNSNYLAPTGWQAPRSIRVTARYEF